jgi:hypothetical protein
MLLRQYKSRGRRFQGYPTKNGAILLVILVTGAKEFSLRHWYLLLLLVRMLRVFSLVRVWLDGFLDFILVLLTAYIPHGTTTKYSAIADLYSFQITTASPKFFPARCVFSRCLVTASNSGGSSISALKSCLNGDSLPTYARTEIVRAQIGLSTFHCPHSMQTSSEIQSDLH